MAYNISEIAEILSADFRFSKEAVIDWLLTDSRSLSFPESTLFFALHSSRGDGHDYIEELYLKGVYNFVIDSKLEELQVRCPEANFVFVDDTLGALQKLAQAHRSSFSIPVIGITGSNGKTIVKEWLYQLLGSKFTITRSPRSYNSQIGVPLSIWQLDRETELGIFEAGISEYDEMDRLHSIIQPTIGVLTSIGSAHQENFSSLQDKCIEKLQLFKNCDVIIYDGDDELICDCISRELITCREIAWSRVNKEKPLYIGAIEKNEDSTTVRYTYLGFESEYTIPFVDDASIENSLHCLAVCLYLMMTPPEISERMKLLEPVEMRLEVIEGINGCTLINDSYNSDLSSLNIALDFLHRRAGNSGTDRTLILSDIQETGYNRRVLYNKVAKILKERKIDNLICIGNDIKELGKTYKGNISFYDSTDDFLNSPAVVRSNEMILLKGARSFHFEEIAERLELKRHKTIMEIRLSAIVDNLNHYRSMLSHGTKVVCMVKASAYGNGAYEIAKTLQDHKVDYLAVAVADEGMELRKAGITMPVMIMDPEVSAFKTLFRYNLEPEVYSFELLEELIRAAEHAGITNFPVHIKIDTGMHRLGFIESDMPRLIDILKHQSAIIPKSVFSHFAGSDSAELDYFTEQQAGLFMKVSDELQSHFSHKIIRHICNTAGIERKPQYHLDMVRLGLGLYGINPVDNRIIHNASSLKSTILQIKELLPEETVGYSRRGVLSRPTRIAAVPIGYADGLNRHLGNRNGYCLVNGVKAQYVGNICMDVCMIDVTDIECKVGDKVEIFGDNLPVTVLSDILGTIPYEILTTISNRVKRVYYQD